jgi:hypothetical protein
VDLRRFKWDGTHNHLIKKTQGEVKEQKSGSVIEDDVYIPVFKTLQSSATSPDGRKVAVKSRFPPS